MLPPSEGLGLGSLTLAQGTLSKSCLEEIWSHTNYKDISRSFESDGKRLRPSALAKAFGLTLA